MAVMTYGYIGSMRTKPGHRGDIVAILTGGADGLRAAGCHAYVVGVSDTEPDMIWVTETGQSKQPHDDSLKLPETREAIARAMPMLTGEFTSQEVTVVGGLNSG